MTLHRLFGLARLSLPAVVLGLAAGAACAQAYPKRPIAYIVPYGAGSGNDVIARIVARKITDNWGQQIVVVNRPGATGAIGLELTASAQPDGHTMVIASTSQIINQHLSKVRYDFLARFQPGVAFRHHALCHRGAEYLSRQIAEGAGGHGQGQPGQTELHWHHRQHCAFYG